MQLHSRPCVFPENHTPESSYLIWKITVNYQNTTPEVFLFVRFDHDSGVGYQYAWDVSRAGGVTPNNYQPYRRLATPELWKNGLKGRKATIKAVPVAVILKDKVEMPSEDIIEEWLEGRTNVQEDKKIIEEGTKTIDESKKIIEKARDRIKKTEQFHLQTGEDNDGVWEEMERVREPRASRTGTREENEGVSARVLTEDTLEALCREGSGMSKIGETRDSFVITEEVSETRSTRIS